MPPFVSIITPTLNRAAFLGEALASVADQRYPAVEHIIVDGGSTDGTAALLARHPGIVALGGPDRGLYDALNKGLAKARGEIIGFLNSDDVYLGDAIGRAAAALARDPALDSVCGGARIVADEGERRRTIALLDDPAVKSLRMLDIAGPPGLINARFFRRRVFDRVGGFDASLRVAGDVEFLLRAAIAGASAAPLDGLVYEYRQHRGSLTISGDPGRRLAQIEECLAIARRYGWEDAAASPAICRGCRRWHAWLIGWSAAIEAAGGRPLPALRRAGGALARDPFWPALFVAQLPSYARWRQARRKGAGSG